MPRLRDYSEITGASLKDKMTGSGKLLLTNDRELFKEQTINVKLSDVQEVLSVRYFHDAATTGLIARMPFVAHQRTHSQMSAVK